MPRLRNLVPGLLLVAPLFCALAAAAEPTISVFKSPTCGCFTRWIGHLEDNGFEVDAVDFTDLGRIKSRAGIAPEQSSCHTALLGNDVIEGHVPASDIRRLLAEQPDARDLTVPGMPPGSPGMETPNPQHYQVLPIGKDASTSVFAEREPHAPRLISERISIAVREGGAGGPKQ
ncbi:DUF411 domain-containing protein [Thiocapsa bogorovii]|uniref:DUF411 domain-containing protein n=1 Tax=Thiocapsa bogorovii TaxID=521689 RepID=UPI001E478257|nr:DUF411 domain-containing protein [Thiocapsa bogorovii]UHD15972.1 DUF411 domain-containing protein [Thiocapsa bogorovii]